MDVGGWLRGLDLGQYEENFRDNKIDADVLPQLTADDLKDIGVVAVGDRRRLLTAIASLAAAMPSVRAEITARPAARISETPAERRQLTVMFCDLVGSTALSARLDPEDMRTIIAAYHEVVAGAVRKEDGFVAKYMGDGVLAYFGYPRAHEEDAERAVRAGLAIVAATSDLTVSDEATLHARVGIATGIVVVGDLVGSGEAQEHGVVGDTPNVAARLQSIAKPDQVVIGETTRRLIGELFELDDLGGQRLKGIAELVPAFAILSARSVESRFDALRAGALTAFVGRQEESEFLLRRWLKSKGGDGQIVLVSGEAGIGKSRLTAALMDRLASEPHLRLRYFCSPQRSDSAFYPIITHIEHAAGILREDEPEVKLDKLDTLLAQGATSREDAALLANLLSLADDGRYRGQEIPAQRRRQMTLEALVRQLEALSHNTPMLMIFEDAQWSDPSSLETLSRLIDRLDQLRVLLIITYRPEFLPPWIGKSNAAAMTLNRLTRREVDAIVDDITGNTPLNAGLRKEIAERADGVPLFAEEITKAVLEAGSDGAAARTIAAIPAPRQSVPASLHASLMARLDRLGSAKEIAQIGAAIGREFAHSLLMVVAQKGEEDLTESVSRLVEAGLLFRQGVPPIVSYLFKHALIQDAAYSTLLRETRRALHARIAAGLENSSPDAVANQPEILARHCAEAGLSEKAARYWSAAAQKSLVRSALIEAIEQFACALRQIEALPSTPSSRKEQIKCQVALITPLMHVKGYAAPETRTAVERARALIERAEETGEPPDDPLLLFSVLYGFWVANYVALKVDACLSG